MSPNTFNVYQVHPSFIVHQFKLQKFQCAYLQQNFILVLTVALEQKQAFAHAIPCTYV